MPLAAALATGLLLFASDHPLRWWWVQFVAFVPFWLALAAQARARGATWPLGACLALGNSVPLLFVLGSSPPIVVAVFAAVLEWSLIAALAGRVLLRGPIAGALAAVAVVTLLEMSVWTFVPLFGTAQSFVRPLAVAPAVLGFLAWTGVAGAVFACAAVAALLASALRAPRRAGPLIVAGGLVAAVVALDVVRWTRPLGAPVRVAAFGWTHFAPQWTELESALADAQARKAELVVTPETGYGTGKDRDRAIAKWGALAKRYGFAAAFGLWNETTKDNRIWFFGSDGALAAEYRKAHLVPWLENYAAGDGTLVDARVGDTPLGGMICQDDNFTDLARGYGRAATPLVAVPTNDWPAIRFAHFDNARLRAIENGYAIVRATSNGISALVSPRGEVLAAVDHTEAFARLLCADVPVGDGQVTVYARLGDWPMLALCVLLLAAALRRPRA